MDTSADERNRLTVENEMRLGLLNVEQYAEAMGLKPSTVRQMVWRREIEFVRIGRSIRFRPEMVETLIERGTVPALKSRNGGVR